MLDIKLDVFEGPLDLLLKLIDKNKIDIYNIPISKLTDEYLYYIKNNEVTNMNEMSEFIVIASMLLDIKAKMLLPKAKNSETNEDIDPREELIQRLTEYKKYKLVAEQLAKKDIVVNKMIFKNAEFELIKSLNVEQEPSINELLDGLMLEDLYKSFQEVLQRRESKTDKIRSKFKSVTKALYNINDKMAYIRDLLFLNGKTTFDEIFEKSSSKAEIVVTFLAMLELIKLKEISVSQDENFSKITICTP